MAWEGCEHWGLFGWCCEGGASSGLCLEICLHPLLQPCTLGSPPLRGWSVPIPAPCSPRSPSATSVLSVSLHAARWWQGETQVTETTLTRRVLPAGVVVLGIPAAVCALGFTSTGIVAGSVAAKMMSAAAIANGGGVAAGSTVAVLQSVGEWAGQGS